jgi:hypothetical protein
MGAQRWPKQVARIMGAIICASLRIARVPPMATLSNSPANRGIADTEPLALPSVTLCAVDTRTPELAMAALLRSMGEVRFGHALLLSDRRVGAHPGLGIASEGLQRVEQRLIPTLTSAAAYSLFVLKELPTHIDTSHALLAQWDGFVADARAWRPEFLQYDYIGAPWAKAPPGQDVGNGGFCLRSRALMQAVRGLCPLTHPEDACIAQTHRFTLETQFGLRFAPATLARHFAFENERPEAPCFGFHGMRNLHRVLSADLAAQWFGQLPAALFSGRDAYKTARDLLNDQQFDLCRAVLAKRKASGARDLKTRWLALRLGLQA